MKPLLVGEQNPYGSDPRYALWPKPERSAGGRLCRLILGIEMMAYLRTFDRVNLCAGSWSHREAVERASALMARPIDKTDLDTPPRIIILLGSKVCRAFQVPFVPFTEDSTIGDPCLRVLILPHPSGLCRVWNMPDSYERARQTLRLGGVTF